MWEVNLHDSVLFVSWRNGQEILLQVSLGEFIQPDTISTRGSVLYQALVWIL